VANLPPVSTTPAANFATSSAGVVDTGGKFATSVNDTGSKIATGVNYAGGNLPLVLATPAAMETIGSFFETLEQPFHVSSLTYAAKLIHIYYFNYYLYL
jgi:hypothetical protein